MERATAHILAALFAEFDVLADDRDDVGGSADRFEVLAHRASTAARISIIVWATSRATMAIPPCFRIISR
jgi:hypothetical protein